MARGKIDSLLKEVQIDWLQIECLVEDGADFTTSPSELSLLWQAYRFEKHELIFALLNRGINLHVINGRDATTDFHRACQSENTALLEVLLEYDETGANAVDKDNRTPLMTYFDLIESIAFYTEFHSDQYYDDYYLTEALEVISLLINKGADLNAVDNSGATILNHPYFNVHLVSYLVDNGANIYHKDRRGYTVIIPILSNLSRFSPHETEYKMSELLIDKVFDEMLYCPRLVINTVLSTLDYLTNFLAILDIIFYGFKSECLVISELGWSIYRLFEKKAEHLENFLDSALIKSRTAEFNAYFLQNIGIDSLRNGYFFYFNHPPVDVPRSFIQVYYAINLNQKLFKSELIEYKEFCCLLDDHRKNYALDKLQLENQVFKRPLRLKTQCRIEIRRRLGFRLHEGIEQLELPTSLKRYLMFCELFSFVRQSCLKEELLKIFFKYIDQL